jgi:CDGSH-type Zn-finger protein
VRPSQRGPLLLSGVLEVRSADLATYARVQHPALCRCGHSGLKPFCDGTHHEVGFDIQDPGAGAAPARKAAESSG